MKLDRNKNPEGEGKYALIEIRKLGPKTRYRLFGREEEDDGAFVIIPRSAINLGEPDQFFVIKFKDRFAARALHAYADAIYEDVAGGEFSHEEGIEMIEFAEEVRKEAMRAQRGPTKTPS